MRTTGLVLCVGVMLSLLAACNAAEKVANSVSGSVGDGPIVGAAVDALTLDGNLIASALGDDTAHFQLDLPDGTRFPVVLRVWDGTDLVTGRAPDFELTAIVASGGRQIANISPLATLAIRSAQCTQEGLTEASLATAWDAIERNLSMGWDRTRVGDPLRDRVNLNNVAEVVLVNEGLGEAIRRTGRGVASTASSVSLDAIVDQLACDLAADGMVDGEGTGVDPVVAAVFHAAAAGVLVESAAGQLRVDGSDATAAMDASIHAVFPDVAEPPKIADVAVGEAHWSALRQSLAAVQRVLADTELADLIAAVDARHDMAELLDARMINTLDGAVERVALAEEAAQTDPLDTIGDDDANAPPPPDPASPPDRVPEPDNDPEIEPTPRPAPPPPDPVPEQTPAPLLTFNAAAASVEVDGRTALLWESQNADRCVASGDWSGNLATDGIFVAGPIDADATYTLTCQGAGGVALGSVSVIVRAAALGWTAPVENVDGTPIEGLSGFKVHVGIDSENYDTVIDIPDPQATQFNVALDRGTYFFSVTALDVNGVESDFSNQVSKTIP